MDIKYFLAFSENHKLTLFCHFRIHSTIVTSFYSFLQPQQNSRPTCLHGGGHDRHLYPRSDFIGPYPKQQLLTSAQTNSFKMANPLLGMMLNEMLIITIFGDVYFK